MNRRCIVECQSPRIINHHPGDSPGGLRPCVVSRFGVAPQSDELPLRITEVRRNPRVSSLSDSTDRPEVGRIPSTPAHTSRRHPNWMIDDWQVTSYNLPMVAGVVVCGTHSLVLARFFAVRSCKLSRNWSRWAASERVLLSARQVPDRLGSWKRLRRSLREQPAGSCSTQLFASSGLRRRS